MPTVKEITKQVRSGRNVVRHGGDFHLVEQLPRYHEAFTAPLAEVVAFVEELRQLCADYFASQDKNRVTNYEDIAYVARQIEDGLRSEYENPALLPLNERLCRQRRWEAPELEQVAGDTADYIEDVVRDMCGRPAGPFDHFAALIDAFRDPELEQLDASTLNHDLVAECALTDAGVRFADGFEDPYGTLLLWSDSYECAPTRRIFKLHGSVDWYRYDLEREGWSGQVSARSVPGGDPFHPHGPNGEDLGYPAGGRPEILTGTFNKILSYPTGIYADQQFRFHEALARADRLLVVGYGFRDKAINARIVAWALRPGPRRMIVVHRDLNGLGLGARGAIRDKWTQWQRRGLLVSLPEHLSSATRWSDIRSLLD
jgi:hypothetical protein